jgi:hypothetical protein
MNGDELPDAGEELPDAGADLREDLRRLAGRAPTFLPRAITARAGGAPRNPNETRKRGPRGQVRGTTPPAVLSHPGAPSSIPDRGAVEVSLLVAENLGDRELPGAGVDLLPVVELSVNSAAGGLERLGFLLKEIRPCFPRRYELLCQHVPFDHGLADRGLGR